MRTSTASYSSFKYVFLVGMCVFMTPPTTSLTNSISTDRVASWRKTQRNAAIEASKQTGSEFTDSTRHKTSQHPSKTSSMTGETKLSNILNLDCCNH